MYKKWLVFIVVFLLAGCTSLVQKGGEILTGEAFAEKTLAVYRTAGAGAKTAVEVKELKSKDGEEVLEISGGAWPGFALRGSMPEPDGSFSLREARFLSSHVHGWNEFTMDIFGEAIFLNPDQAEGILRITGEVERVIISGGMIRLKSGYITGAAAMTSLRNRRERITALVGWMNERLPGGETPAFTDIGEFELYWETWLFPELVPGSYRPEEYSVHNAEWKREDSVRWNLTYTKNLFPEGLWEYRNSGAMLRDWDEALPWIFMEYSWNKIIDSFNNTILQKVK
ncbi:MAG: hypothetical protein LBQ94_05800 [Treponema sp.]|jgi:hypothetical protein|nr:hypothetical protein [Treponema sp.]